MTTPIEERARAEEGYRHTAFGLALSIDQRISIPGLGQGPDSISEGRPSHIRLDEGELHRRWEALPTSSVRMRELRYGKTLLMSVDFAESAGYLLWARDFGRVLISADGIDLLCEPDPVNKDWATIVSAQALPLAATLRGLEVMHASGVVLGGKAVLIMGPSGAGKSSLAAALIGAGGQLLSDDAVALTLGDGALSAYPGSVLLRLRATEDERLSAEERDALGHPASFVNGRHRYLSAHMSEAVQLGSVLLLERSADEPAIEQLVAVDPFELIASTFNLSVRTPARLQRQLDVVSAIASAGLAHRLRVQPGVDATQLAAIAQENFAWLSGSGEPARSGAGSDRARPLEI
jgi:hypothetical protein